MFRFAGKGWDPSARRALDLFKRSCDRDSANGCRLLGLMLLDETSGVRVDRQRGVEALRRACSLGSRDACSDLSAAAP